jgi:SPP1 family predicted phage head-tail adaptor
MGMAPINAGELDRRIQLQSATITNDADYNQEVSSWATYATVWAKMEFHRATESEASAREYAEMGLYLTTRYRDDVTSEHRVILEGTTYEIIGRPRELGRREGLKLQVKVIE